MTHSERHMHDPEHEYAHEHQIEHRHEGVEHVERLEVRDPETGETRIVEPDDVMLVDEEEIERPHHATTGGAAVAGAATGAALTAAAGPAAVVVGAVGGAAVGAAAERAMHAGKEPAGPEEEAVEHDDEPWVAPMAIDAADKTALLVAETGAPAPGDPDLDREFRRDEEDQA